MEEDGYELFHTAQMSVTERLIACLRNETMTDVALVGDDGIPVPAARYILGSASAAFQPLLYGGSRSTKNEFFAHGSNCCHGQASTVNIREANYKSLAALVEFCCSDELNTSIWATSHPLEIVQDTVALAKLAHTYEVPFLQIQVRDFLSPLMAAYPPLACSVFNLADSISTPDVYEASLVILQENPYVALKTSTNSKLNSDKPMGGIVALSPTKLEAILADNEVEADELFLFQQLVQWRDYNQGRYPNANEICRSVVHHLDLSSIDPNEIETTVMQSGFVAAEMLVQALIAQAKSATDEGLAFACLRGPRGKKYAHVLVQGAGEMDCNGVYVHVQKRNDASAQQGSNKNNLVYFIKKPAIATHNKDNKTLFFVLVQDSAGIWRICDSNKNIMYERPVGRGEEGDNGFPRSGWTSVVGAVPPPECSLLRGGETPSGETTGKPNPWAMDEPKSSSPSGPVSVASSIGNGVVAEEKKEASEDADHSETTEKRSAKVKRKIVRTSALVDEELDDCYDTKISDDPILGTTVGGDGFFPVYEHKDIPDKSKCVPKSMAILEKGRNKEEDVSHQPPSRDESVMVGCSVATCSR